MPVEMSDDSTIVLDRISRKLREVELLMSQSQNLRAKSVLEECCININRIRTQIDTTTFETITSSCTQLLSLCDLPSTTTTDVSTTDAGYCAPREKTG